MNKWNTIYNENYNLTKLKFKVKKQYNLVYHNNFAMMFKWEKKKQIKL